MDLIKKESITSLELVEQINIFRKQEGNRAELQHYDLLKIIRDEFEEEINDGKISAVEYKDKKGELRPMYSLTLQQGKQVLMRESKFVRKKVIEYIEYLENKLKETSIPKTYAQALLEAGRLALELEQTEKLALERKKTIDLLVHENKLYTATEIAKELGLKSANELNNILSDKKIQYKVNNSWVLYSDYSNLGYVSLKQNVLDNGKIIYDRKWTGEGRKFLLELFSA